MKTIKKIVIIGPESTGKSTLSAQLAQHFGTHFVAEYAREYIENLDREYTQSDLLAIAKGQIAAEEKQAVVENKVLLCETDLYVLKIWSEVKYNACDTKILNEIAKRNYDLYLLTGIDMPWQYDKLREHPEPHMRAYIYKLYLHTLAESGVPVVPINGNEQERLQKSIRAIENIL